MLYPFIYNDNDAYCLHGWCVFFMYILNGDFVANLNIAVNVDQEIDANLTNSRSVLQVVFNRYHPLLRFSKHDFPLLFETIVLWSWNWPFNTLENVHGKNELDLGKTLNLNKFKMKGGRENVDTPRPKWPRESLRLGVRSEVQISWTKTRFQKSSQNGKNGS